MIIYNYKQFIKESKEDIDSICQKCYIQNYTINDDGSIDVDDDVDLCHQVLNKLPLKFRNVSGHFDCSYNFLTSLEGCPQSVGDFYCENNGLTSLYGCPQIILGDFDCQDNEIIDFKGFPEFYEGEFYFSGNPVQEILKLFHFHEKSIYWINEHDVIRGNKIILQRLEEVAYELKMKLPENITFENYEII